MNIHKIGNLELIVKGKKSFCFIDKHVHPRHYQNALGLSNEYSVVSRGKDILTVCRVENKHLQLTYEEIVNNVNGCLIEKRESLRNLFDWVKELE